MATMATVISMKSKISNNILIILIQNIVCFIIINLIEPYTICKAIKTKCYSLHLLRALFGVAIYIFYYKTIKVLSPVSAVLLLHTAPIFIPLIEIVRVRKLPSLKLLATLFVGFLGLYCILHPSLSEFQKLIGIAFGLISGFCFAVTFPLTKALKRTESIPEIISLYSFHSIVFSLLILFFYDNFQFNFVDLILYLIVGLMYFCQIYLVNKAIAYVGPTISGAMTNLSVIFAILLDIYINRSIPVFSLFVGLFLVLSSSYYLLRSESTNAQAFKS